MKNDSGEDVEGVEKPKTDVDLLLNAAAALALLAAVRFLLLIL